MPNPIKGITYSRLVDIFPIRDVIQFNKPGFGEPYFNTSKFRNGIPLLFQRIAKVKKYVLLQKE